jgi:hypothetical protein
LLTYFYSPKTTDHNFQKYRIFRSNFTFSSMETMETRGEPSDNWYFAKGQLVFRKMSTESSIEARSLADETEKLRSPYFVFWYFGALPFPCTIIYRVYFRDQYIGISKLVLLHLEFGTCLVVWERVPKQH